MIALGNQNQFPSSFAPLRDLFKAPMFLLNMNGLNSSRSPPNQGFENGKGLPRCGRKRAPSDFVTFSLSPFLVFVLALLVCFAFVF